MAVERVLSNLNLISFKTEGGLQNHIDELQDGDLVFTPDTTQEQLNNKIDKSEENRLNTAGMVMAFAGTSAPSGWLKCDGSAISRTTYAKLFAAIGTTYGTGDGSTTFNLPTQSVLPLGTNVSITGQAYGNGKTMGLTEGTNNLGMGYISNQGLVLSSGTIGNNVGTAVSSSAGLAGKSIGLTKDASKSGIIVSGTANLANATGAQAIVCIKY